MSSNEAATGTGPCSIPAVPKPLDFRFLDEGLGGQLTKKRKRQEHDERAAAPSAPMQMDIVSADVARLDTDGDPSGTSRGPSQGPAKRLCTSGGTGGVVNAGKASGRKWKDPKAGRASSMRKAVGVRRQKTLEERQREKQLLRAFQQRKAELKEEVRMSKQEKRRQAEERKRRKAENELKGAVLQKITNTKTLKKMSKKQLKQLVRIPG